MITEEATKSRQTKYCNSIKNVLAAKGHATNNELLVELRKVFPELSATTVHRASARLSARGEIGIAPATKNGSMRYDGNINSHDHFHCTNCDLLRDTDVKRKITPILEDSIGDCQISGRLTIGGICKNCMNLMGKDYA
jgi:Fur family transcriptional regulator, ferric uptake regulator